MENKLYVKNDEIALIVMSEMRKNGLKPNLFYVIRW